MTRKTHVLNFSPNFTFAKRAWALNLSVSRKEIPLLCKELHFLMQERHGMAYYYPQVDEGVNFCRFEWTRRWRNSPVGLHLGILLKVERDGFGQSHLYVTTNDAIAKKESIPKFRPYFEARLREECAEIIDEAIARTAEDRQAVRHAVFYMKLHPQASFGESAATSDGTIIVFPSSVIDGEIVSAVRVSVTASSNARAKPNALDQFGLLCALLTLAEGVLFDSASLKWPKRRKQPEFLDSTNVQPAELYPKWRKPPVFFNAAIPKHVGLVHDAFRQLSPVQTEEFLPALYAYFSAERLASHPTQEIVALLAALASLTSSRKEICPGDIICSECGRLFWKHDLVGERLAITELVAELTPDLSSKEKKRVSDIITRAYSKQRSGFVHAAKLRHEEYYKDYGLPHAFPTATEPVRDVFFFREDWVSMKRIARRALLAWLEKQSGVSLCPSLPDATGEKVTVRSAMEGTVTLPPNRIVAPFLGIKESGKETSDPSGGSSRSR